MKISQLINLKRENVKKEGNYTTGYVYKNDKKIKFKTTNKLYNDAIKAKNEITKAKNEITKQKNQLIKMNKAMNKIMKMNDKLTHQLEETTKEKRRLVGDTKVYVVVDCDVEMITVRDNKRYMIKETHYLFLENDDNIEQQIKQKLDELIYNDSWCFRKLLKYEYRITTEKYLQNHYKGDLAKVRMFSSTPISYYYIKNNNPEIKEAKDQCVYDVIKERYDVSKEEQFKIYNEYYMQSVDAYNGGERFTMNSGVSTHMLKYFCEQKKISIYALSIDESIITKQIVPSRHKKCLVYFMVNAHMYLITQQKEIMKIVRNNDNRTGYTSTILENDTENEINDRDLKFTENKIIENVDINNLLKYNDINIIYPTNDLKDIFMQIFKKYNFVPRTVESDGIVKYIKLNDNVFDGLNIDLCYDPNHKMNLSYKVVQTFCEKMSIPFTNQSMGTLARVLADKIILKTEQRIRFTKEQRNEIKQQQNNKCNICKTELEKFHIDHILPLASGGSNDAENLQGICISCHNDKTKKEREITNYVNDDPLRSSYNSKIRQLMNSEYVKRYAFIENMDYPEKGKKVFSIDINKCRKNIMRYSKYDFPVFTVMDEVKVFDQDDEIKCGVYYVEPNTDSYYPLRGNAFYSQPMIDYCISNNIISKKDIKYKLIPSLTLPKDYFNEYIDTIYQHVGSDDNLNTLIKQVVNSFIGSFANTTVSNSKTLYTTDVNDASYLSLSKNYEPYLIEQGLYKCIKKTEKERDDDSRPIYNMIIDMEVIELHKLSKIIQANKGTVLSLNTDCVYCQFEKKPMEIKSYCFDEDNKVLKYKYENKDNITIQERMKRYKTKSRYEHQEKVYNIIHDNDDFKECQ